MPPPSSEGGFFVDPSDEGAGHRRRTEGKTSPQTRRLLFPYRLAFHIHELVDRGFHGIMRLGVFGVFLAPFGALGLMVQSTNRCVGPAGPRPARGTTTRRSARTGRPPTVRTRRSPAPIRTPSPRSRSPIRCRQSNNARTNRPNATNRAYRRACGIRYRALRASKRPARNLRYCLSGPVPAITS